MNSNGLLRKHWFQVSVHFLLDALIFVLCFVGGAHVVFGMWFQEDAWPIVRTYLPSFAIAAGTFSSLAYIMGLYSSQASFRSAFRRFFLLLCCVVFAALIFLGLAYVMTARPLGRGYMAFSTASFALLAIAHHLYLLFALKMERERVGYIVTTPFDEGETHIFTDIGLKHLDFAGVIAGLGYEPSARARMLGTTDQLAEIVARERIDRILVRGPLLRAESIRMVGTEPLAGGDAVFPSDHFGLVADFTCVD